MIELPFVHPEEEVSLLLRLRILPVLQALLSLQHRRLHCNIMNIRLIPTSDRSLHLAFRSEPTFGLHRLRFFRSTFIARICTDSSTVHNIRTARSMALRFTYSKLLIWARHAIKVLRRQFVMTSLEVCFLNSH